MRAETAPEYVNPLHELQCDLDNALEVAEHLKTFELKSGNIYFEAENLASSQNSVVSKTCGIIQRNPEYYEYQHIMN